MANLSPEEMLKKTAAYADNLDKATRSHVAVGLPQEKVGGKIYGDGMTVIRVGAIHEYGSTFMHPGGTPYVVSKGKAFFVSKSFTGPVSGVTKPHKITIPRRSFLRAPFNVKKDEINKVIAKQFRAVAEDGKDVDKAMGIIGLIATNISKGAFTSRGYGTWPDIKSSTKRKKGSSQPLIDTGTLRRSITHVVRS